MLSILIPIYGYDVRPLVGALSQQLQRAGLAGEIRCYDDGSPPAVRQRNAEIARWPGVVYRELPRNLGRARIRNLLAREAPGDYLLFLDADSRVTSDGFLAAYLRELPADRVLYGGRTYAPQPPADGRYYLHWKYGRRREAQRLAYRRRHPYRAIMTNNLLVPRRVFERFPFDEQLLTYGHEDTLFGALLQRHGVGVGHIDAPLEHIGLEDRHTFLEKQRLAVHNLYRLRQAQKRVPTRLTDLSDKLRKGGLSGLALAVLGRLGPLCERRLREADDPPLAFLDGVKLWWWLQLERGEVAS